MQSKETPRAVFGYGSLVNRRTHDTPAAWPGQITGWRRAWRASPLRARPYLTVVPEPGAVTWGLVATVPDEGWPALDAREHAYAREPLGEALSHTAPGPLQAVVYAIAPGAHHAPGPENPVLLSYIDVVVQGFLAEFGPEGAAHFFESTEGWQVPVTDDRARPAYARAEALTPEERALVDAGLSGLGVRPRPA